MDETYIKSNYHVRTGDRGPTKSIPHGSCLLSLYFLSLLSQRDQRWVTSTTPTNVGRWVPVSGCVKYKIPTVISEGGNWKTLGTTILGVPRCSREHQKRYRTGVEISQKTREEFNGSKSKYIVGIKNIPGTVPSSLTTIPSTSDSYPSSNLYLYCKTSSGFVLTDSTSPQKTIKERRVFRIGKINTTSQENSKRGFWKMILKE